jgi:prevent-host-death family protein
MKASIVDLRYHMKDVLRAIDRGETVTVLYRGKEKAKLVPIDSQPEKPMKSTDHPAFGMWKDREDMKDPSAWVRKIRRSRIRDL